VSTAPIERPDWIDADPVQGAALEEFLAQERQQWLWLFRSKGSWTEHSIGQFSALLDGDAASEAVKDESWDASIGGGGYGFSQYREGEEWRTVYEHYPRDGIELFVHYREWHGVKPASWELSEEFRLLFNLWEERSTGTYYYFDDSGNPIKAAVVNDEGVKVLTSLARRFQAAKQMHLALYIDATLMSADLPVEEERWEHKDAATAISYYRGGLTGDEEPFSRLFGKRLLEPPPIEASKIWPYEEEERDYLDFIIGTTDTGDPVRFTSDPGELANYFGANAGNPHYLTPVYFRPEVLTKYYSDPERYSVEDGYLRCAGLWGLRMDNDKHGHVMVFLGDLGHLPAAEAEYWRSFNIEPPDEGPSETLFRRAFGGEFADPQSVHLRFPRVYTEVNKAWANATGQPLYKELHQDDRHVLAKLHVPLTDSSAEFDEQVLYLAKLVVDSLNVEALQSLLGSKVAEEKGLAKLERLLRERGAEDPRSTIAPLATVQGLRSRGAAHRKGSDFDITVALGEAGRQKGFEQLLEQVVASLEALKGFASTNLSS
jgi:hypothetical protein